MIDSMGLRLHLQGGSPDWMLGKIFYHGGGQMWGQVPQWLFSLHPWRYSEHDWGQP